MQAIKMEVEYGQNGDNDDTTVEVTAETSKTSNGGDNGIYKWVVVFGCFMCFVILGGIDRCEGIFYLKFRDRFHKTAQETAWPGSLAGSLRLILAPLATIMSDRFSGRTTMIIGGILVGISSVVSGFAPNLTFLYFSFGVLGGLGRCFAYCPGLVIVRQYCIGNSGLAIGLATAGGGAGTMVLPPLISLLFDHYNFSGAFLLLAGIALNVCVFGALLRPLKAVKTTFKIKRPRQIEDHSMNNIDAKALESPPSYVNYGFSKDDDGSVDSNNSRMRSTNTAYLKKQTTNVDQNSIELTTSSQRTKEANVKRPRFMEMSLLRNPTFLFYCISSALFTSAFKAAYAFLPALAQSHGCSETEASYLLSISGVLDTACRVGAGVLLDLDRVRRFRPYIYSILLLTVSCISFIFPALYGFWQFVIVTSIYGALTGAYVAQKSIILVDILGLDKLRSSLGIFLLSQGLGSITGPPLSGFLKDVFDDYAMAFYLGGSMLVVATTLMIVSNVFLFMQRHRDTN